ncbi:MAG: hypothetical protein Q4F95_01135 [Oscillospiraceae bacterium]|nr:hypothetical protein [Oscillospiraceae bacterium]
MKNIQRQKWKQVEYSRSKIIRSGKIIKNAESSQEQIAEAITVIDNWRAAHAFPLHVIYMHLRRMANSNDDIIVAERLKRIDSIIKKLSREHSMSLWEMQDLGGCRFIVPTVSDVYSFAQKYDNSRKRHVFQDKYDYIAHPKPSGYRSLHMVYKYYSDTNDTYNRNMLIEIQYRTHLQHLWATAVETMGLFTKQAIKSGQGSEDIKRFFVLISSLFAIKENQPIVPGTIEDINELVSELEEINSRCNFLDMLSAIRVAVDNQEQKKFKHQGYYILILNYNTKHLSIKYFMPSQIETANEIYGQIESERSESRIDAVLVRVSSFQTLKLAYPNYFSDIGEFLEIVRKYLKY